MLALYCDVEHVVRPGDRTSVHVSTTASTFRLELYPLGGSEPVWSGPVLTGKLVPAGDPTGDWQWPDYPIDVPSELPGGVYLVVGLELGDQTGYEPSLVGYDATALLAITPDRPASTALYKLPMRTYLAYNPAGGASLYVNRQWRDGACVAGVRRPGAGIGGPTAEPVDIYAPGSPRQTFRHWDGPFLSWASERGYALDVVFDTALDSEPELLGRYRTLVTAGHDEYWTTECRERTEKFVADGGNLLVFGGNTCWWRAEVRDGELRVAKDEANPAVGDLWWRTDRPEASLIGLSFRHGGASWLAARPPAPYEFRPDGDALLDGVDLAAFAELTDLAGYEVDGHAYEPGRPWQPSGAEDVPDGLVVLAYAPLADAPPAHWYPDPRDPHLASPRCATIAYRRHGDALVFNGGTTDWPRHLDHPAVDRLTRNVLDAAGVQGT